MKLKAAFFVMMGALLLAGSVPSGQKGTGQAEAEKAKCVAKCKSSCQKSFEKCKQSATTPTAVQSCQKSLDTCNANCANRACG